MADLKISELPLADPLTTDELIPVVQSDGASPPSLTTVQTTLADILALASGVIDPATNGFLLTLSPGNPLYDPQPATPTSTDTGAETVTFSANTGWTNGTICTVSATANGLTAGTVYYLHVVTASTVFSFHTTVADAISGSSPVNLSGSITAQVIPSGASNTSIYFSPYTSELISLFTGSAWESLQSAEVSLALGTLTADKNYDVFAYNSGGTLTLELSAAWASDIARTDAVVMQNGAWVKSGATTKRLVGTIRTNTTTTTAMDIGGYNRPSLLLVSNLFDTRYGYVGDNSTQFNYTSGWQQWRNSNTYEFRIVSSLPSIATCRGLCTAGASGSGNHFSIGFGLDSSTDPGHRFASNIGNATGYNPIAGERTIQLTAGYHAVKWIQSTNGAGTTTWYTGGGAEVGDMAAVSLAVSNRR